MEKIKKVVDNIDAEDIMNKNDGTTQYGSKKINIGDGCEVLVELEDGEEQTIIGKILNSFEHTVQAATNNEKVWKKYGNRYFTAKCKGYMGIGTAQYVLENHYKLSANGIDERYGVTSSKSTSVIAVASISNGSVIISDAVARTPGKSDVNMYAKFYWSVNVMGYGATSGTDTLHTSIKYLKKDASKKQIQVQHKWNLN